MFFRDWKWKRDEKWPIRLKQPIIKRHLDEKVEQIFFLFQESFFSPKTKKASPESDFKIQFIKLFILLFFWKEAAVAESHQDSLD